MLARDVTVFIPSARVTCGVIPVLIRDNSASQLGVTWVTGEQPESRVAVVLAQLLSALKKEFSKEMESVEANKVSITTKGTR